MFTTKGYFRDIMLSWFKSKADRPLTFPPIFTVLPKRVLTRVVGAFLLADFRVSEGGGNL